MFYNIELTEKELEMIMRALRIQGSRYKEIGDQEKSQASFVLEERLYSKHLEKSK